jgi:alpha/beta superfamily hydrolase
VTIDLEGPAGRLEALLDVPAVGARGAAVLAHPHPDQGGSMRSRVVHEAAAGLVRAGAAVLRFNYRGVGTSTGVFGGGAAEADDCRAALGVLAARFPGRPLWTVGYSFGAWVAMEAGAGDDRVTTIALIAPPLERYDFGPLARSPKHKLLVQAELDRLCPLKAMHRFYGRLEEPKDLVVIDGADHAFDGKASEVGDALADLLGGPEH